MSKISSLAHSVSALAMDVRAEVVINNLIESCDISENQFVIYKEGQFVRAYRYDILEASEIDYDLDSTAFLKLSLSRDSLYDTLPENIVHSIRNDTPDKGVDTMIKEYREQQRQQKQARLFFAPFENEMFAFGVETEAFENAFLTEMNGNIASDIFYQFWGLSKEFPPVFISKLIKTLPFAYKIVGNIDWTVEILSFILKEKVEIKPQDVGQYSDEEQAITLGGARLGIDFITGHSYNDYSGHYRLLIGPLENHSFQEYVNQGILKRFVHLFCEYFFPLEMDIDVQIILKPEDEIFEFKSAQPSFLGYNTTI